MDGLKHAPVYVVDGCRTPFLKARGKPGPFAAADLLVAAGRPLLARQPFEPPDLDEVIVGCVIPSPDEVNIARVAALRLQCGDKVPAWTVQRNCASGMQALESGMHAILSGRSHLVLAGGVEAMSRAPLLLNRQMVDWLGDFQKSRALGKKLKMLTNLRARMLQPVIGLLHGLTDPVVDLSMGQTAEVLAHLFHIPREAMDAYALESHQRLARAADTGMLADEIEPVFDDRGNHYDHDDGLRRDVTMQKLASLRPAFDRSFGVITAGNSAQITDGAALLLLASEEAVQKYSLPVMGRLDGCHWAGVPPERMGLGPVHAVVPLLKRFGLSAKDIDFWELNEAFAAQVLACLKAWADADYCREQLGLDTPFGGIDRATLNIDGGAIALGHPVGASGARIVLHLLHILRRTDSRRGVATLCIGGGQGGAMLVSREDTQ